MGDLCLVRALCVPLCPYKLAINLLRKKVLSSKTSLKRSLRIDKTMENGSLMKSKVLQNASILKYF